MNSVLLEKVVVHPHADLLDPVKSEPQADVQLLSGAHTVDLSVIYIVVGRTHHGCVLVAPKEKEVNVISMVFADACLFCAMGVGKDTKTICACRSWDP